MRRILVLVFALVLAACATSSPRPPPIAEQMAALQTRLFIIVEEKRHRLEPRAKPLMLDPQLTAAAQVHAEAMAKAHTMDGKDAPKNLAVEALMKDTKFQGFVAENVAQQYYHARHGIDVNKFAQTFLELWLAGADQRWNITFRGFDRTGIGIASDGKAIYVSQVFSTDLGLPPPPDETAEAPPTPPEAPPAPAPKPEEPAQQPPAEPAQTQ
jgi:uncharacterized protein YkwD